ncbi:MAG: hypothetical protein ABR595_03280, partial [Psychroflexus sp.]
QHAIDNSYNAHNQFLQTILDTGIFGVFCLVLLMIFIFYSAIRHKNLNLLNFIIIFFLFFSTDSVLSREYGAIIFGLFLGIFLKNSFNEQTQS